MATLSTKSTNKPMEAATLEFIPVPPRLSQKESRHVYFVGASTGPIKIGIARDIGARLNGLQTSHPQPLGLYAYVNGGKALERQYHGRFQSDRLAGEWFQRSSDVVTEILRLSGKGAVIPQKTLDRIMPIKPDERISLTLQEAQRLTGLGEGLLRRLADEGHIRMAKIGGRLFIKRTDLQTFMDRQFACQQAPV